MTVNRWTVKECVHCGGLRDPRTTICANCAHWMVHDPIFDVVRAGDARRSDPDTSKQAALAQAPRSGSQRARILAALREMGPMTAAEIGAMTGIAGAWKRVSELKAGGHIHEAGTVMDSDTQAEVATYRAGPAREEPRPALFEERAIDG